MIRSMLALKAAHHPDEPLPAFVRDIEQRIQAIALVHQKLYQSRDLSRINLLAYLQDILPLLLQGYGDNSGRIALTIDGEDVLVLIDTAIPCGLIISELMSNALRHAFPDQRSGEIRIRVDRHGEQIELVFADNGVGVPSGFDPRRQANLGLHVLLSLIEQQLKGQITWDFRSGVAYTIRFQDNLYTPRVSS